jgi:hypothetical protein
LAYLAGYQTYFYFWQIFGLIHLPTAVMKSLITLLLTILSPCAVFAQIIFQQFPTPLQLYPRDLSTNTAKVHISGTAAASADSLIFTLEKSDGTLESQALSLNDLTNNQFDVSFDILPGLWSYHIKAERQVSNNLILLKEAENVVAGDVFVVEGQSNAQAVAYNGDANIWQNNFVRCFGTSNPDLFADGNWYIAEGNGYFSPGAVGQWALRLGSLLQEKLKIPVAIINGADPGKPIEFFQRNDAQHTDPSTNYGRLLQRLINAGLSDHIRAMMYYQGESDGNRADIHKTLFEALHADWEEDFSTIEAYYVVQVREGCGAPSLQLREYQRAFEDYLPNTKAVTANGINGHDGCHYNLQGYKTLGEKIYKQVSADLYNMPSGEQTNIRAISARFTNDFNTQITLLTDATSALTVQAGSALDFKINGASASITGIQADGNKLILDLDQSINFANSGLSYGGHSGSDAWVLNGDGYGMFTFYNLGIDNYHIVPNFDIPGIMSGSGNCLSLDGTDDFVMVGSVLNSSYTKEAWINWQGGLNIISGAANTAFWTPNGVLAAGHNGAWFQVTDNVALTPNQWTHVAVSYDATSGAMSLYKNGKLVSQAQNIPPHNDPVVYVGAYAGCCTFQGNIDEARIWDTVRTLEEIRANMCQKLKGTEANLSAYFRFDETAGGVAPNETTGPDGQLTNFQGLGLNEAWQRSGAPIGTKSTYSYNDVEQLNIGISAGDSLVLSTPHVPDFVHLYFVEEVPNVLEPAGDYVLVDNSRYFGLFYANQSMPNYNLKYFYADNPFANVQEQNLGLLKRKNNAQSIWNEVPQFQVDQNEHSITGTGTIYQEFILAIRDSMLLNPLSAQLTVAQTLLCSSLNDGAINVTAQGGQIPYTYRLNGGMPQSSGLFTGLSAGSYQVLVTDQLGISIMTNMISLQSPDPLIVATEVNENNAVVTVVGGTTPYAISSNALDFDFQNLPNGTYYLRVVDANGCESNTNFTIDYQPLTATTTLLDLNNCDGLTDLVVIAQGGESPYQYSLNNGAFQAGNTFTDLSSGIYAVKAIDMSGKILDVPPVQINIASVLLATVNILGESISVIPSGGTLPYQYSLNGAATQFDSIFTNLAPGEYGILISDAAGCTTTATGTILASGTLSLDSHHRFIVSPNPSTGLFELQGQMIDPKVHFSVLDVTGRILQSFDIQAFDSRNTTKIDLSAKPNGIYLLQITDGTLSRNFRLAKIK